MAITSTNTNVKSSSRFKYTPFSLTQNGQATYGLLAGLDSLLNIIGSNLQPPYLVPSSVAGRPDLIAYNQYNNSHLEWIVVLANRAAIVASANYELLGWPFTGSSIRIPTQAFVRTLV